MVLSDIARKETWTILLSSLLSVFFNNWKKVRQIVLCGV